MPAHHVLRLRPFDAYRRQTRLPARTKWASAMLRWTSALGHEQTSRHVRVMSVLPLKADIRQRMEHVSFVPLADIGWTTCLAGAGIRKSVNDSGRGLRGFLRQTATPINYPK